MACQGARPLAKGMKAVGNAVTVRFVPWRPDITADKPQGELSPEYVLNKYSVLVIAWGGGFAPST